MQSSIEIFDVRGRYPLKTGKLFRFAGSVQARMAFEDFMASCSTTAEKCAFVALLKYDEDLADLFFVSEEGFQTILGENPQELEHYKTLRKELPPLTIAEQRNLKAVYNTLTRSNPDRFYNDPTVIEEMVLESSAVRDGLARCSNCNLPMFIETEEDHRCYRCGKEKLCSYCLTAHTCSG